MSHKLLLIDVMPLLYRGHFAFAGRPRTTARGVNTSAIFVFTSLVAQMIRDTGATHAAFAMDTSPTFRHEKYPPYKAQREKMPEDIAASIPMAEEFAKAIRIPFVRQQGYEADDVIGTLAARGEELGFDVSIFTPDKDFAQLVTDKVTLFRPGKGDTAGERYGPAEVCDRWGLSSPRQMIDFLGLAGDSADNIPGVSGVGEKTAMKLLQEFGSLDEIIRRADDIKGKLSEKVKAHEADAKMSRWLAEICRNVPLEISVDDLRLKEPDLAQLSAFCAKYELASLARKYGARAGALPQEMGAVHGARQGGQGQEMGAVHGARQGGQGTESHAPGASTAAAAFGDLPLFAANAGAAPQVGGAMDGGARDAQSAPEGASADARDPRSAASAGAESAGAGVTSPHAPDDHGKGAAYLGAAVTASQYATLASWPHEYTLADSEEKRKALLAELLAPGKWAFDTETTGLDPWVNHLVGMSFSTKPGRAWYVPLPQDDEGAQKILEEFRPAFARTDVLKIGHNLKFDMAMLHHAGVEVAGPIYDTMLAHYVFEPAERHSMDALARAYLEYDPISITTLIGERGVGQLTMDQVPVEKVGEYASEDADVTMRLYEVLMKEVKKHGAEEALERCENALVPVLLDMEGAGIKMNPDVLYLQGTEMAADIEDYERKIKSLAGVDFNLASPKQLGEVLFDRIGLPDAGRTRTGQYNTSEEALQSLSGQHPIIDLILKHRACMKLKSTYIDKLPSFMRPETGRVHTSFNQALTETGRLSSDNPNLQNIPVRTEQGRRIRQAFVPQDDDHVLMSADYSQIELRIAASMSGDETMIDAFLSDADVHKATAARVNRVPIEDVTKEMRGHAKMVNFGIIYGISAFGLAQRLKISRGAANDIIKSYFAQFPKMRELMEKLVADARERGHTRTMLGHVRPLRDINSRNGTMRAAAERLAINTPVQGTAAELIKLAMVAVHDELRARRLRARLLLQIHDELILEVPKSELDEVRDLVRDKMEGAMQMAVPLKVEIGIGSNWLEAH